jgi:hypothetical protein
MTEVTVIICTHNPRPHYLRRVLEALREQTLPVDGWELLLVDNASRHPLANEWDLTWQPNARHVLEPELGLAPARRRGIRLASADLLVFVDDDNVLERNYLAETLKIKQEWPQLGTWGSAWISPDFELAPSAHLLPYISYLALRDRKVASWSNLISCRESIPVGAGLCVRSNVAAAYLKSCMQSEIQITDRKGASLLGHGDYEICFVGCSLELGMGIFPQLRMTHLIPKERTSDEYFIRLLESSRASGQLLAHKWQNVRLQSPYSLRGAFSVIKNILTRRGFERRVFLAHLRGAQMARRLLSAQVSNH